MTEAQAVDRDHRISRERDVVITHYFIQNSIEHVSIQSVYTCFSRCGLRFAAFGCPLPKGYLVADHGFFFFFFFFFFLIVRQMGPEGEVDADRTKFVTVQS
jgi:hypothetical protein